MDRRRFLIVSALGTLTACGPDLLAPPAEGDRGVAPGRDDRVVLRPTEPRPTPTSPSPTVTTVPAGIDDADGVPADQTAVAAPLDPTGTAIMAEPLPGDVPTSEGVAPTSVPAPTSRSLPQALFTHGDRRRPMVALTFDACETPTKPARYDEGIVSVLMDTGAAATMFLCGHWAATHSDVTVMLGKHKLFEIGNHSWGHPDFRTISDQAMDTEINRTQTYLRQLTGRRPALFRLPYGYSSPDALAAVARNGLRPIQWEVVTGDPDPNIHAQTIINTVNHNARNGSIIIMHMNGRGWHTAEALPTVIGSLRDHGFHLVTVSQLLGLS